MRSFTITIGQRGAPRLSFEARAENAFGALIEHSELRQEGERMEVAPVFSEEELLAADVERSLSKAARFHARNDAQALDDQVQHLRLIGGL